MRFLRRACSVALSLSASLLLFSSTLQTKVFAETQTATVQLTAAQTMALYGQSFNALYYNGSQVQNVTFTFDKSTRTICDNLNSLFTTFNYNNTDYSILPSNAKNAFTMFASDNAPISQFFNNCLLSNSSWLGVDGSSIIDRNKIVDYEFLLYKCEGISPRPVNSSTYDFQFNIPLSVSLSGVESLKTLFMFQIGMFTAENAFRNSSVVIPNANLRSEVRLYGTNQLVPIDVTSDTFAWNGGTDTSKFGLSMHPINTCDVSLVSSVVPSVSTINTRTSQFGIFSMDILDSVVSGSDITGINWNVRAGDAQFKFLKQDFDPYYSDVNDPNSANYQYQDDTIYLMLMCPIIQGDYQIGRPSGSGSIDYTAPLNDIIDKLDQIVQNLNIDVDFDTTSLENTVVSTGNSIVTGIKNLFIPSQTDLINFRLDLEDEFHSFFPAMYTAENKIDYVFRAMQDVSVTDSLIFPGVSVDLPTESGGAANFKIDSGSVPLKPASDRLGILYDCLAGIIDIVATLAFFNMLRNRFNRFFGEGAEE